MPWRGAVRRIEDTAPPPRSTSGREAILANVAAGSNAVEQHARQASPAAAAIALSTLLDQSPCPLDETETALLRRWLDTLARQS